MNCIAFGSVALLVGSAATLGGCCRPRVPDEWRCNLMPCCVVMPAINGVVRATDPPSDRWVVSAGRADEVEPGFEFIVFRGSEYVATLVIDEVGEHESTGHSKPRTQRLPILDGDECAARH